VCIEGCTPNATQYLFPMATGDPRCYTRYRYIPNCAAYQANGSGGNFHLSCVRCTDSSFGDTPGVELRVSRTALASLTNALQACESASERVPNCD
jgi:hypothetical protein